MPTWEGEKRIMWNNLQLTWDTKSQQFTSSEGWSCFFSANELSGRQTVGTGRESDNSENASKMPKLLTLKLLFRVVYSLIQSLPNRWRWLFFLGQISTSLWWHDIIRRVRKETRALWRWEIRVSSSTTDSSSVSSSSRMYVSRACLNPIFPIPLEIIYDGTLLDTLLFCHN